MSVVRAAGALLLVAALSGPALAAEPEPGLVLLLSQFHEDPTPEALERFQPGLGDKLAAVAGDPAVARLARVRALWALGRLGDDRAFAVVSGLAVDRAASVRLRIAALTSLGRWFQGRPERVKAVEAALADPDPGVRERAVRSLAAIDTAAAWAAVEAHRFGERHAVVRQALREVRLQRLGIQGADLLPREGRARAADRGPAPDRPELDRPDRRPASSEEVR